MEKIRWEMGKKMFIKIQEAVRLVNQEFIQSFRVGTEYRVQDLRKICRFLEEACEDLFYQMVRRLERADELSKETVFIDGTKIEACANKYTFVWKKSVGKWEKKCSLKSRRR